MKFFLLLNILIFSVFLQAQERLPVGTVLNKKNASQYSEFIDKPLLKLINDDYVSIKIGETVRFPLNKGFVNQTKKYKDTASIDTKTGKLLNYQEGLPFVGDPIFSDPQAGLKIAWNMRYAYGGNSSLVEPFIWHYKNMKNDKVERTLSFVGKTLRFKHRVSSRNETELPNNASGIFNTIYLMAKEPFDLKNTQLLVHRLEDDSARERSWLYLSVHRRVRRLPTGQSTDAFLGSDIMIEDFIGYNGRIMDMTWNYLSTEEIIVPFFNYDQIEKEQSVDKDGFSFGKFHGKGHCFPDVPWQVRKVYKVEAVPKWAQHPLSKRIFYIDAETHIPVLGRFYDRAGKIWRIAIAGFSHPDHHLPINKGSGVAIPSLISMIDVQAQHCTTLKMKTIINSETVNRKDFTVQALRRKGK